MCCAMLSGSVASDLQRPHGLQPTRLLCPWTIAQQAPLSTGILQERILEWVAMPSSRGSSKPMDQIQVSSIAGSFFTIQPPGKPRNTGVGSLSLLQRNFLTQDSKWGLLHCRQILYQLSYPGSCRMGYTDSQISSQVSSSDQVRLYLTSGGGINKFLSQLGLPNQPWTGNCIFGSNKKDCTLSSLDTQDHCLGSADKRATGWALCSSTTVIGASGWASEIPRSSGQVSLLAGLEVVFSVKQICGLAFCPEILYILCYVLYIIRYDMLILCHLCIVNTYGTNIIYYSCYIFNVIE